MECIESESDRIDIIIDSGIGKIAAIESFVISSNLKYVVTSHYDSSLAIWNVDLYDRIIDIDERCRVEFDDPISLLGLSNNKLLIFGYKSHVYGHYCDHYSNLIIRNMNTFENITITPHPSDGSFLQFLPNGNLLLIQEPYIYVYSEASLRKSRKTPYSYSSRYYLWGVEDIDISYVVQINGQIFLTLLNENIIHQLNTENRNIENHHIVPEITEKMVIGSVNCRWEGAVNSEGNLFAVHLTTDYPKYLNKSDVSWIYVFSMKNGLQISSRKVDVYDSKLQFMDANDTEILILYSCSVHTIKYTIMNPYDLSHVCKGEYDIQKFILVTGYIRNYMILGASTLQCQLMFTIENKIKLIDFNVPEDIIKKLYDQMKNNNNLVIYSSFNDIKDSYNTPVGYHCKGKKLKWEFLNQDKNQDKNQNKNRLQVYIKDELQNDQTICLDLDLSINFRNLKILSNDDLVLYSDCDIHVFGFNEKTNNIVPRYYYNDIEEFLKSKRLPNPCIKYLNDLPYQNKLDLISEILCSKKHLVEMSDDIICHAFVRKGSETLGTCLNKLYESFTEDTMTHYRICNIITKYLQRLNLEFPTHYAKFLSITSFIPNPNVHKSYLSDRRKMVGYTEHVYTVQIYKYKFIQNFWNYIHRIYYDYSNITKYKKTRVISFVIPYLGFTTYPSKYSFWMDFIKPKDNQFVTLDDDQAFYESWNAEALLNFKWHTFGRYYYCLFWGFFTMFLLSFGIVSTLSSSVISNVGIDRFLFISIILGLFHIFHEVRQIVWNWYKYITDPWNWFDLCAYFFPVVTAMVWLSHGKPPLPLISISNLFLHFKFMTFLRAFHYFGSYFTIITGVAKRIFFFLLILFLIIISFAHAFYILLAPLESYNLDEPSYNKDPNNPWNLVNKFQSVSPDGKINSETAFIQQPDSNINQFSTYDSSLFAMYLFLSGDSSAFSSWPYHENPFMTILLTMFSFLIVVYLMNLFIGLLNLEIEINRAHSLVLLQKARILAEIELFLLLPNQRRWNHWFPDVIFYEMPIEEVRQKLIEIDNNPTSDNTPYISHKLRKLVDLKVHKNVPMTSIDCENLINKSKSDYENLMNNMKTYYENLVNKTKAEYENLINNAKTNHKDLVNNFMTKDNWKDSKQEFLNEIKNLINMNKNISKKVNSNSNDNVKININNDLFNK
ncbi:16237_t:CDS:2 [Funneliformis geosporum]|nr:16237_t:CDS:2 [Funneliformis geosporum]